MLRTVTDDRRQVWRRDSGLCKVGERWVGRCRCIGLKRVGLRVFESDDDANWLRKSLWGEKQDVEAETYPQTFRSFNSMTKCKVLLSAVSLRCLLAVFLSCFGKGKGKGRRTMMLVLVLVLVLALEVKGKGKGNCVWSILLLWVAAVHVVGAGTAPEARNKDTNDLEMSPKKRAA